MAVESITENELINELRRISQSRCQEARQNGMTSEEIRKMTGWCPTKTRATIREAVLSGVMTVSFGQISRVDGRMQRVPFYSVAKKPKKRK